jgi:hypothetical protein
MRDPPRRWSASTPLIVGAVGSLAVLLAVVAADPFGDARSSPGPQVRTDAGRSIQQTVAAGSPYGTVPAGTPAPSHPATPGPSQKATVLPVDCRRASGDPVPRADELLMNRLTLHAMETVDLPDDPDWTESPLGSRNWEFQYHSLRFVLDLVNAFDRSGDARYRDRAAKLLRDWHEDNPPGTARSPFAWNDHATAWRATVYACAAAVLEPEPWLEAALTLHGRTLAAPGFYRGAGNHALNQNVGLLDVGCRLGRQDWMDLAALRLDRLVVSSVDEQGVTNEQAVFYQYYNWNHYSRAVRRLRACGVTVPASLARIDRMPDFLAHATLPNGEYVVIGDTPRRRATPIAGLPAEFAATSGAQGPRPSARMAIYDAGYCFGRTGWGETRPMLEEVAWSARFGPGVAWHGHDDGMSITLFGAGTRLIDHPGTFTYNIDRWRTFASGRSAHNVITVDGRPHDPATPTTVLAVSTDGAHDYLWLRNNGSLGIEHRRQILFSAGLGYLLVADDVRSRLPVTLRQLWHLVEDGNPVAADGGIRTTRPDGNVLIQQLIKPVAPEVVIGQERPVQGWLSHAVEHRVPAPVVSFVRRGASVRYLTLLLPFRGRDADPEVADLKLSSDGFSLVVTIDGTSERVAVNGGDASVEPLP